MKKFNKEIKYSCRYVDDIFAVIKEKGSPEEILENINKMDDNMKFTLETEKEDRISFLDVEIMRKGGEIETTVYRKPESTIQIINRKCRTLETYKYAAIRFYIDRVLNICSSDELLKEEFLKIKKIANEAGYRKREINKIIERRRKRLEEIEPAQKERMKFTETIGYMGGIGVKLRREMKRHNFNVPIKPDRSIFQRIRNEKEKIDPKESAGIYRIPIKNKEGKEEAYIGMTKRKIRERIKEHERDIKYGRSTTALSQRNNDDEIEIEFNNTKKLAKYTGKKRALKREAIEIISDERAINIVEHSKIDERWRHILRIKNRQSQSEGDTSRKDRGTNEMR